MTKYFLLLMISFLGTQFAQAYPQFIGYGYGTCITCHYNGHGGGPINDYGRALWGTEIASKSLYPRKVSDERIGETSGFMGSIQTPIYLKPHFKYRGLWNKTRYGSLQSQERIIHMQLDGGVTSQFDQDGNYLATLTFGTWPIGTMIADQNVNRYLAREYYVRAQPKESWWLYAGLMERVYGIRNIDHTSYSRTPTKLAERSKNSSAIIYHGLGTKVHKIAETWEGTFQVFQGHPNEADDDRQKGFSMKYEKVSSEESRWGVSFLNSENKTVKSKLLGGEFRRKIAEGSSFMFESGLIEDIPAATNKASVGSYSLLDTYLKIVRGYHFKLGVERYNQEFNSRSPDIWQWSIGLMAFPINRLETRLDLVQTRNLISNSSSDDAWSLRGQLHVSL